MSSKSHKDLKDASYQCALPFRRGRFATCLAYQSDAKYALEVSGRWRPCEDTGDCFADAASKAREVLKEVEPFTLELTLCA